MINPENKTNLNVLGFPFNLLKMMCTLPLMRELVQLSHTGPLLSQLLLQANYILAHLDCTKVHTALDQHRIPVAATLKKELQGKNLELLHNN